MSSPVVVDPRPLVRLASLCAAAVLASCGGSGASGGDVVAAPTAISPSPEVGLPRVDASRLPQGHPGYDTELLRPASAPGGSAAGDGQFRLLCAFSHMAFDDPIIFPGQPGASHLHAFFGNKGADAFSTAESLANSGRSTCRGGTLNRSAYWVPAMIDTRDGRPIAPTDSSFYYKTGFSQIAPTEIQPIPMGLRMLTGDAKNAAPQDYFAYSCEGGSWTPVAGGKGIPNCEAGVQLRMRLTFPQCWDGRNLDSPDHKSHMSWRTGNAGGRCPASHPVALPEITFNIYYNVTEANSTRHWRLSSDGYSTDLPGGFSAHGDWYSGWNNDIVRAWTRNCLNLVLDCGGGNLGDGRHLDSTWPLGP